VPGLSVWPQPPSDNPLGERESVRIRRDFWDAIGSGQVGVLLLVIGVLAAAGGAWVAQTDKLDALATAEEPAKDLIAVEYRHTLVRTPMECLSRSQRCRFLLALHSLVKLRSCLPLCKAGVRSPE